MDKFTTDDFYGCRGKIVKAMACDARTARSGTISTAVGDEGGLSPCIDKFERDRSRRRETSERDSCPMAVFLKAPKNLGASTRASGPAVSFRNVR